MYYNLSAPQLNELIYSPLKRETFLQLNPNLPAESVQNVTFVQFCKRFLQDVQPKPIKLTAAGNLPRRFVHHAYDYRLYPYQDVDNGSIKLRKEEDFYYLTLAHYVLKTAGLVKKSANKLSITQKSEKWLDNDAKLYSELLKAFANKFNWSYLSYFEDKIGQWGWGYLIFLLMRFGDKERSTKFYSDEYQLIVPDLLREIPKGPHIDPQKHFLWNVEGKFFGRFCQLFNLAEVRDKSETDETEMVKKTELVDLVFVT